MMNPTIGFFVVVTTVLCLFMSGCEKEGPMEKAGKKVDDAVERTADAVDDAIHPQGLLEKAGAMVDEAVEDVKEGAQDIKEDVQSALEEHQDH